MSDSIVAVRLETIGQLIEHGYDARLDCEACEKTADLDLETIARQLGPHFPLAEIRKFASCPHCGGSVHFSMRLTAFSPKPDGHPMAMRMRPRKKSERASTKRE